eukprot:5403104-Alexandrium_andersonii.AAC.1
MGLLAVGDRDGIQGCAARTGRTARIFPLKDDRGLGVGVVADVHDAPLGVEPACTPQRRQVAHAAVRMVRGVGGPA